ncbi:sugar ABC transporter ATP-binding protein [Anaerotignum sp.]|uniref:sugar ABC transporter ATP-binding protein n=1 Tax=Anaerotignum sp. TaxID=2039241 RepID=UPI0028B25D10|nr:sugar ABC transporter ATP-binding protein [Anaerotignum sp.]
MNPCLQVKNISKRFQGVKALTDVSIDFYAGEMHCLLGENGAGKSTLIKIISGVYSASEGEIVYNGQTVNFQNPRQALDAGISVIHQELSIANDLTVAENIFLGAEQRQDFKMLLDRKRMNKEAQDILDFMRVDINATQIARELTAAQQQMVEIAKVMTKKSKVVIMDEPTSSLSELEINALFEQIRILKEQNVAIIYITHRLKEMFVMGEKVTVLRDGCKVDTFKIADVTEKELVANMVGREIKDYYNRQEHTAKEELLRVEGLTGKNGEFKDISFAAHAGEILGFAGLVGAGRTEVMEAIFGARSYSKGKIFVSGKEVTFKSPIEAINAHIGFVTEDRRRTGLMLNAMIKNNIVLPSLNNHCKKFGFLDFLWEKEASEDYVDKLKVRTPGITTEIANLSGGNQQKVILAKWLLANSKILILDEPTRGIDVNAKSEFYALMNAFVANGGCIIMVSSELPEILGNSDRIIVMREGEIAGELHYKDATEQNVIELASLHSKNTEE